MLASWGLKLPLGGILLAQSSKRCCSASIKRPCSLSVAKRWGSDQVTAEDLNSTNGTYIDGNAIKLHALRDGDMLEVGKYKIRFDSGQDRDNFEKTMIFKPSAAIQPVPPVPAPAPTPELHGWIKVLSGAAAGREMALTKVVTTVGKPGISVAAITQRRHGFFVHHVEGSDRSVSYTHLTLPTSDLV